jgi:hypothetical protein
MTLDFIMDRAGVQTFFFLPRSQINNGIPPHETAEKLTIEHWMQRLSSHLSTTVVPDYLLLHLPYA